VWCWFRHCGLPAFLGYFHGFNFLRVSAPRDRMCICNTAHTRHAKCSRLGSPPRHPASASRPRNELRARSPLTVCQPDFSHAKNYPSEMHTCAVVKCDKCELWCFWGINQSHSPGCIAIHCARIHPLRFWRLSGGLLPVSPFCRQKRAQSVLAVRVMMRYGK
jgi:hypothetical protein